jgi:protein-tyrosine phosphatase
VIEATDAPGHARWPCGEVIADPDRVTAFLTDAATGRPANLRDLGGTRTDDGYRVRHGVLYRSDAPQPGDPRTARHVDLPQGSSWPPATVIDLRSAAETVAPHPLGDVADVRPVPLGASLTPERVADASAGQDGLAWAYRLLAAEAGGELARIVRIVADAPAPVLVHCAAGKDRTGLVVGVLLAVLGVPRATIVEDYLRTNENLRTLWARLRQWGQPEPGHDALLGVDAAALEAVLDDMDAHSDGVLGRLREAGVTDGDLRRLAERLLEPDLPV